MRPDDRAVREAVTDDQLAFAALFLRDGEIPHNGECGPARANRSTPDLLGRPLHPIREDSDAFHLGAAVGAEELLMIVRARCLSLGNRGGVGHVEPLVRVRAPTVPIAAYVQPIN